MTHARHGLTVRGDSLYCPLAVSLDPYANCLTDCWHCYLRRLNHVWGKELKPLDPEVLERKLVNGLKNKNPRSALAHALASKKAIRLGNKTDPFQDIEKKERATYWSLKVLEKLEWEVVFQTHHTETMMEYADIIMGMAGSWTVMPVISPGLDWDWELLERKRTTPPRERLGHLKQLQKHGVNCGVNGEPFIPGHHTIKHFEDALKLLKSYGIKSYNVYNLHFNDFTAKRLHAIGVDIEAIWWNNQDAQWKPILAKLLDLSKKHGVALGCPDFVNSGPDYREPRNTCCGIQINNPTTFNTHTWKRLLQETDLTTDEILENTWDGIGDQEKGRMVIEGKSDEFYTLADAGVVPKNKKGLGL